ncbi:MAG: LysR family transcriptional regulator [Burkholderiaceae bacterium]|nr:LysR family transcriptional regulator [Burkholderiaceae bacterium]
MAAAFDPATLDWNLLRALGAVLEQGSLTAAAARLGCSQPTLSRQIAALERQLAQPLFERTGRRLRPSAAAQALAEPAQRMLAAARALAQAADAPSRSLAGTVRLTASQVVSAFVLPPLLARLAELHPEIQIELVPSDQVSNLLEREADIAVRMLRPTQGTLITRHLGDWKLGFYVHRRLLQRLGRPFDASCLDALRWVGLDQQTQLVDGFRAAGFDIDHRFFGLRCDQHAVGLQAVLAGVGVGLVLQPLAARHAQLQQVLPGLDLPVLPLWLTAHRELRASRRLRVVWDFLAAELPAWAAGEDRTDGAPATHLYLAPGTADPVPASNRG